MILLVDVGNSRVKWVLEDQGEFIERGGLWHRGIDPAAWGDRLWSGLNPPARIVVANVAGARVADALAAWFKRVWAVEARFVTSQASACGVTNSYANPAQMGVDRWVAMIGARRRFDRQACCIVDCGTAITIDALSADGQHLGGVIFPGARLMREALYRDTRQIPDEPAGRVALLGQSTRECVWGGTIHAAASAIDGIAARMEETVNTRFRRLLTGGDGEVLLPYLSGVYDLQSDLIFAGLLVIVHDRS